MWTITLVPGGTIGVTLKLKLPCMYAYTDSFGFIRAERSSLRVILAWGINLSHSVRGKSGSVPTRPDLK